MLLHAKNGDGSRVFVFADAREPVSPVEDDDDDDEVRKLKVCIELKGLRLSKPAAGAASPEGSQSKQERAWSHLSLVAPGQSLRDHKIRAGEPDDRAAAQRADINRKWGCEKLLNGKNEPAAISTEFSSGNGNMSLARAVLLSLLSFGGFPAVGAQERIRVWDISCC